MKISGKIQFTVFGLILIGVALLVINRYDYSWVGITLSTVGLCLQKSVYVTGDNGQPMKLSYGIDLDAINQALAADPNYDLTFHETYLRVSRRFGNVRYTIVFDNYANQDQNITNFNLNTFSKASDENAGEDCSVPTAVIRGNIYTIINDLPLTESKKSEIRESVRVSYQPDLNFPM
ncbi:MAG: hypothetical protein ACREO5_10005 [Candidatus Binatia bacterium]